jgi:hypothetical protein
MQVEETSNNYIMIRHVQKMNTHVRDRNCIAEKNDYSLVTNNWKLFQN